METTVITIKASILANAEKVWNYYTQPAHITQWNFATPEWHCPHAENDLRAGGKYLARMEARDGSFGFDFEAVYTGVKAHERLDYVITDGRKVTVELTPVGSTTEIIVSFEAETENSPELQRDGWQAILNNFRNYVESN
jgi:uncharacterized protein YndB with AHSA1/START domain